MASKGTGKYYARFYRAKKSPAKMKRIKTIRHIALLAAAVAVVVTVVTAWQVSRRNEESFMEVAASRQSLAQVTAYPRIVSHTSPVGHDEVPDSLVSLNTVPHGESVYLRADAAEAFLEMLAAMSKDGLGVVPVKGYLSYEEQQAALEESIDKFIAEGHTTEEAQALAADYVLTPGEDEAQLGTSVDISTDAQCVDDFAVTEQYQWICAHAHEYGFVVRYTSGKKAVTGISAKPWHLRYVGKEAAEYMKSSGMCLEEYAAAVREDNPSAAEEK